MRGERGKDEVEEEGEGEGGREWEVAKIKKVNFEKYRR